MKTVNRRNPIRRRASLNRGLLRWWLCLPSQHGGLRWRELTAKNSATIVGALPLKAGGRPGGFGYWQFDGTNDSGQTAAIDLTGVSTMTVSCWLYWDAFGTDADIAIESSASSSTVIGAILLMPNAASGAFLVRVGVNAANSGASFVRPSGAAWHHYSFCFNRNAGLQQVVGVYLNGVSQALTDVNVSVEAAGGFGNHVWNFMCRNAASAFGAGRIDDLRLYNRVLGAGEARALYRASRGGYRHELRRVRELPMGFAEDAGPPAPVYGNVPYHRRLRSSGMAPIKNAGETISSLDTAKPLTTIPGLAKRARVVALGQSVHYREDGGTPTSTVGTPVAAGGYADIVGLNNLEGFRVIEDSASASLWVEYFDSEE